MIDMATDKFQNDKIGLVGQL